MMKTFIPIIKYFFCLLLTITFRTTSSAQNVTGIYTDFGSWWASGIGNINTVKPNDVNNLLGFTTVRTISGVPVTTTFSTGNNDALLTSKGISFAAGDFKALPVSPIPGTPGTSTFVGTGSMYGGVDRSITHPSLTNTMNYYLTDGKRGLDLGTAVFNVQSGTINYKVDEFNIAAIGDGMPDIIATQMGDYPTTNDVFKFVDVNGVTVGNQISLDFSQVISVGNASWSFYQLPTVSPFVPIPYGGPHGDRLIRLRAWDLTDFGLTQTNVGRIYRFTHTLTGSSDPAFMAYNTTGFRTLTTIIPGCGIATPGMWLQANDGITLSSGKVTTWNDQSSKALHVEQTTAANMPAYKDGSNSGFNFNPYVNFDNGNWLGHANSPFDATTNNLSVFIIARPTAASGTNKILGFSRSSADVSSAGKGDYPAFNFNSSGQTNVSYGTDSKVTSTTGSGLNIPGLWEMEYTRGGAISTSLNGIAAGNSTGSMDLGTWYSQLGDASPGNNQADFDLGEVIVFPSNITADQKQKTSSYLGLKYGISLPFSYLSGSGITIWDYTNNTYNYNIIGVGREDCQGLIQKQSTSVADTRQLLTVGMTKIAASTKNNVTSMADGQYMMWGDNNGSLSSTSQLQAQKLCLKKPDITWRTQRTGAYINTQNTQIKIHASEINWAEAAHETTAANYYLLIDRNANGSYQDAGDTAIPATLLAGGYVTFNNVIWDNDGSGTDLFTIALKVDEVLALAAINGSNTACIGGAAIFSNSVTGGVWSSSDATVATINAATGSLTGLKAGSSIITYKVANARGCETAVTKEITINNAPTALVTGGGTACEGESVPNISINLTGTAPWSFIYTNGSVATTVASTTANPYNITGASSGTYSLTALNDANCSGTFGGTATVTVISQPLSDVIQPACIGDKGHVEITQPLGTGILYSINGIDYQTSPIFTDLDAGTYHLTTSNGTCTSSYSIVSINASPTAPTPVIIQPSCDIATGTITIPAVAGAQYSINNGEMYQSSNVFSELSPGNYTVVIYLESGCKSPEQNITVNTQPLQPAAPVAGSSVIYCIGEISSQLVATGTNLLWYSTASGGVGTNTAPTPPTNVAATRLYYVSQTSAAGCESPRTAIQVIVKPVPDALTVSVVNNCNGTSSLSTSGYTGTLLWNTSATTANIIVNSAGNYTVKQTVDGCASPAATVTAAPKTTPATPIITVVNNCDATSTLTASNYTGTLLWSNGANSVSQVVNIADTYLLLQTVGGCASSTASATTAPKTTPAKPTVTVVNNCGSSTLTANTGTGAALWSNSATTSAITVVTPGSYSVTRTLNGCVSASTSGTAAPVITAIPTGSATQTFCIDNPHTIANLTATGTTIKWYNAASGGTALASSEALENGTIYYASQTLNSCESATRLAVTAVISTTASPTGSATQTFCLDNPHTIANLTATGTTIKWYNAASGGTALVSSAALENGTTYYASQTLNSCESAVRLAVTAVINTTATPTGSLTQTFCESGISTIASLKATGTDVKWYDVISGGVELTSSAILENGKIYYASQTLNSCESAARLAVTAVINTTATPTGSLTQAFCESEISTIASLTATGTDVKWYDVISGGIELTSSAILENGKIYYASQTSNSCESTVRLAVTAVINVTNAPTTAQNTQNFCETDLPTIAGLSVSGINTKWYDALTGGNLLTEIDALQNGKIYYATQTKGTCESLDRLAISVILDKKPGESQAGTDQQHFNVAEFTMNANVPDIGTGSWIIISGTALIADDTDPKTKITVDIGTTAIVSWIITNGNCSSASSLSLINAILVNAGTDQSQSTDQFTMSANSIEGTWRIVSVDPEELTSLVQIAEIHRSNTKVTIPGGAKATFSWTADGTAYSDLVVLENTSPLPVTLISFSAIVKDDAVNLNWATSSETNNTGFDIERSSDARAFSVIGFEAAKTSQDTKESQNYQHRDSEPLPGLSYYRLAQKDVDGTVAYSRIVAVDMTYALPDAELYPNPSSHTIYFKNFIKGSQVSLFDNSGYTLSKTTKNQLNISTLVPGLYYIKIVTGKKIQTLKFMKD